MEKRFPEEAYLNGHKGTHVSNGVYKVDSPYDINCAQWVKDRNNTGYIIIGADYSDDFEECSVVYFANSDSGCSYIGKLLQELNEREPDRYGYIQCIYGDTDIDRLGGYVIVEV